MKDKSGIVKRKCKSSKTNYWARNIIKKHFAFVYTN